MASLKRSPDHDDEVVQPVKKCRLVSSITSATSDSDTCDESRKDICYFQHLSLEVLCKLISYLPLRDALKLDTMCRRLREAVSLHLKLIKTLELSESHILGPMPSGITDYNLECLVNRCPNLEFIQGLFTGCRPVYRQKNDGNLTVEGVVEILRSCEKLKAVELDNTFILEAVLRELPQLRILGGFINHGGGFPISDDSFSLSKNPKVRYLHLTGVTIPELPRMDSIIYLYMRFVKFTHPNPFSTFMAPNLHTFVMSNCAGPVNALKYVPLVTRLAASRALRRLELVRVPFLGGLFQHVLEDTWRFGGFSSLENITLGACKYATEVDLGHLILTCAQKLFQLVIQPSLTKDNMFLALSMAEATFPRIETLHLSYVDSFPEQGRWTNAELEEQGLSGVTEHPALITDTGVQIAGKMFSNLRNLIAYNCPYLKDPMKWLVEDGTNFAHLRYLHLHRCHSIRLRQLTSFIADLPCVESIYLQEMFKEPPKGCGHVGLSAGTALGVSAAFLASQDGTPAGSANNDEEAANRNPVEENPGLPEHQERRNDDDLPPVGKVAFDVANAAGVACGHASGAVPLPSSSGIQKSDPPKNSGVDPKDRIMVEEIDAMFEAEEKERMARKAAEMTEDSDDDDDNNEKKKKKKKYDGKGKMPMSGRKVVKGKKSKTNGESSRLSVKRNLNSKIEESVEDEKGDRKSDDDDNSKPGTSSQGTCQSEKIDEKTSKNVGSDNIRNVDMKNESLSKTAKTTTETKETATKPPESVSEASESIEENEVKNLAFNADTSESNTKTPEVDSELMNEDSDDSPKRTIGTQTSKSKDSTQDNSDQSDAEDEPCAACEAGSVPVRPPLPVYRIGRAGQQLSDIPQPPRILPIQSGNLISLTLYMVGVEEVALQNCTQLTTLHVTACRVLKSLSLGRSPELYRVTVAQCPQFCHDPLLEYLSKLEPSRSRVVFLRPMYKFDLAYIERCLFRRGAFYQGFLVQDHSSSPSRTIHNKPRFEETAKLLTMINKSVLKDWSYKPTRKLNSDSVFSSRHLMTLTGVSEDTSSWEIMTDVPWYPTLASTPKTDSYLPSTLAPAEFRRGIYSPKYHRHTILANAMKVLRHDVAEFVECRNEELKPHVLSVFINTCDTSGQPTSDIYV